MLPRLRSCCAVAVLAACLFAAPHGAIGAPEESLAERLRADAAAGLIDRDEAAIYAHLALFARDQLPPHYASLSVEAPRCATGVIRAAEDAATRVDPELRSAFEAAGPPTPCTGDFSFGLRSSIYPLTVHYEDDDLAAEAQEMLRFAEESWALQVEAMGQTPPLLDGGACGPDGDLDLYLLREIGYAYVDAAANNPDTPYDDWSTYMVIDPDVWGGVFLEATVAHEFQHMLQAADDWWEINMHEATATLIEEVVDDDLDYYVRLLRDFARRPFQPLEFDDDYRTNFLYGMVEYFLFLRDRYFAGDASFLGDFWRNTRSRERGCYCAPQFNEPDFLDSLDVVLGDFGPVTARDSLIEFSRWRWFVGSQDDGAHFEEGGRWPNSTIPPMHSGVETRDLPTRLDISDGPMTNGVVYVEVTMSAATNTALRVTFSGDARYDWHVETLRDLPGTADTWDRGLEGTDGTLLVDLDGSARVILKVLNLANESYDPDFLRNRRTAFSLDLELAEQATGVRIDIRPGSRTNPVNTFAGGILPVAILGSDSFQVEAVDLSSLAFGPGGAAPVRRAGGQRMDVNRDGFPDLLVQFATREAGLSWGDDEACIEGALLDGSVFESCDAVHTTLRRIRPLPL